MLFVIFGLIAAIAAQRPSYAGTSPKGFPSLANRFKDPNETNVNLGNRIGEGTSTTGRIPIDALGDSQLVDRLNQWPRENRPFWLLNSEHIEAARNSSTRPVNVQSRSSFLSSGRNRSNPTGSYSREPDSFEAEFN